ncbi:hypothetical protein [Streptomyces winkii]|uniref:hypothetical protein n=1 Tax=Streptomyces winkii TaxID=3051178 RepID=UPI0028D81D79|nr:hypothetical protein [Streptomyces sp. DSM 40971]
MPSPGGARDVDVDQVLRYNYRLLTRFIIARIVIIATLIAVPFVAVNGFAARNSALWFLPALVGVMLLILTVYRLRCGVRLVQCAKVLRTYPLRWQERVDKKSVERTEYGNVYTVRLPVRGQHGAPWMWALNAAGSRRWPEGAEDGVWFAGDPPFGGVAVAPRSKGMLFLNPADWEKLAKQREEADADRIAKAQEAKLDRRNWKRPIMWRGG